MGLCFKVDLADRSAPKGANEAAGYTVWEASGSKSRGSEPDCTNWEVGKDREDREGTGCGGLERRNEVTTIFGLGVWNPLSKGY